MSKVVLRCAVLCVALVLPPLVTGQPVPKSKQSSPKQDSVLSAYRAMWFSLNVYYVNTTQGAPAFDASRHRYPVTSLVFDVGQIVSSVTAAQKGDSGVRFLLEALSYRIADAALAELIFTELAKRQETTKTIAGQLKKLDRTPCANELLPNRDLLDVQPEAYCLSVDAWRESLGRASNSSPR